MGTLSRGDVSTQLPGEGALGTAAHPVTMPFLFRRVVTVPVCVFLSCVARGLCSDFGMKLAGGTSLSKYRELV